MSQRKSNIKASALFSATILMCLFLIYGAALQAILLAGLILLVANLTFLNWKIGAVKEFPPEVFARSLAFTAFMFFLAIAWIKITSPSQLGYGEQLQFDGRSITTLGYWVLAQQSLAYGAIIFLAGIFGSMVASRVNYHG